MKARISQLPGVVVVRPLGIPDVLEISVGKLSDNRGFLSEVWSVAHLRQSGISVDFVQENHSYSGRAGVLRGLHFQEPPFGQAKLVRVPRGAIFDVAVDIRRESPTFGRWVGLVVSSENWKQVFIPEGFAHGFVTLQPECEVLYKVSAPYSPSHDKAIHYDDPVIGIDWPKLTGDFLISDKDRAAPPLKDINPIFRYPTTSRNADLNSAHRAQRGIDDRSTE